jgi:hypothetical protein
MSEVISAVSFEETELLTTYPALKTIVAGGMTAGIMDCLAATINAGLKGVSFSRVWQYVASGALGKASYDYGGNSVILGLFFHFLIAFTATTVFYFLSRWYPVLISKPFLFGPLYGIVVYFFMGYLVVPLSLVAKIPFSITGMLIGISIHIVCVGLPIALITRRFANPD